MTVNDRPLTKPHPCSLRVSDAGPPLTAPPHPPGTAEPEPERTVELHHENGGFGLILGGGGPSGAAVRINEVIAGSSAHAAHLQSGQEIVRINGNSVERMSVERVTTMLSIAKVRSGGETTTVTVRSGSEVTLVYVSNRPPPAAAVTTTTTGATYGSQHGSPADPWLVRRSPSPGASLASSRAVSQASLGARDPVDDLAEADPAEAYARMRRDRDQLRQELMRAKQESAVLENRLSLAESANEAARAMERDYDEIITLLEAEVAHLRAQLLASPDDKNRQLIEYRRRCIMLGCQVNKAVEAKKTSDEALDVLTKFARGTKDKLEFSSTTQSKADRGLNVRRDGTLRARPFDGPLPPSGAAWSVGDACMVKPDRDGGAPRLAVVKSIQAGASSVEGYEQCVVEIVEDDHAGGSVQGGGGAGLGLPRREVVGLAELMPLSSSHYAVASARGLDIAHRLPGEKDFLSALERLILQDSNKALAKAAEVLESEVLPFGFEEAFTNDGTRYFIDHVNQTTSFLHPCTKRLPDDSAMSHMRPPTAF